MDDDSSDSEGLSCVRREGRGRGSESGERGGEREGEERRRRTDLASVLTSSSSEGSETAANEIVQGTSVSTLLGEGAEICEEARRGRDASLEKLTCVSLGRTLVLLSGF